MLNISEANFVSEVVKSSKPVVIDFWASWCMPCQMMGPVFEGVSKLMPDVKFVKVNVDENQELASRFFVSGIPTIIVFKGGVELSRFSGYRDSDNLVASIKEIIMTDEMND